MDINNPQDVNKYIVKQTNLEMGSEIEPIISDTAPILGGGVYIYAIKADGAANLVLSSITSVGGNEMILDGEVTILAGDVLYIPCSTFVIASGLKYVAYLRSIK